MPSPEETGRPGVAARIVTSLLDAAMRVRVADVRIGLGYTGVRLEDGGTGVAFTFRDLAGGGCSVFQGIRPLATRPAADLLVLLESPDAIEAGVGLACANALVNRDHPAWLEGDILDHLHLGSGDDVAMVGHFGPLVEAIRERARSLTVFERVERSSGPIRPREEAATAIPGCQVALITATSIINHTIDDLLRAAEGCREVVLLGASTPLIAEAFSAGPVTMLAGVVVREPDEILRIVSEGGGMRQFGPHVRKVTVKVRASGPRSERSAE